MPILIKGLLTREDGKIKLYLSQSRLFTSSPPHYFPLITKKEEPSLPLSETFSSYLLAS